MNRTQLPHGETRNLLRRIPLAFTMALVLNLFACGGKTTPTESDSSPAGTSSAPPVVAKILFQFRSLGGNVIRTGQLFTPTPGEEGKIMFLGSNGKDELVPIEQISKLSFGKLTPGNGANCLHLSMSDNDLSGATLIRRDGSETHGCVPADHVVAFVAPEVDPNGVVDSRQAFDVREPATISPNGDKKRIAWALGTFTRK